MYVYYVCKYACMYNVCAFPSLFFSMSGWSRQRSSATSSLSARGCEHHLLFQSESRGSTFNRITHLNHIATSDCACACGFCLALLQPQLQASLLLQVEMTVYHQLRVRFNVHVYDQVQAWVFQLAPSWFVCAWPRFNISQLAAQRACACQGFNSLLHRRICSLP